MFRSSSNSIKRRNGTSFHFDNLTDFRWRWNENTPHENNNNAFRCEIECVTMFWWWRLNISDALTSFWSIYIYVYLCTAFKWRLQSPNIEMVYEWHHHLYYCHALSLADKTSCNDNRWWRIERESRQLGWMREWTRAKNSLYKSILAIFITDRDSPN